MITLLIDQLVLAVSDRYKNLIASSVFFKALAVYAFIKILLNWQISSEMAQFGNVQLPAHWSLSRLFTLLSLGISDSSHAFSLGALLILLFVIWRGANYLTNILLCLICVNLYTRNFGVGDGADLILLTLSIYSLPLAHNSLTKNDKVHHFQMLLFNASRILIQCHIAFIYLNSGLDKLLSDTWKLGEAMNRIRHYEGLFNTNFPTAFQNTQWDMFFSWATIVTELTIPLLIWVRPFRSTVIILAVLFHFMIWWMVSLPDFAWIMIISLLIFVDDDRYSALQNRFPGRFSAADLTQ